MPNIQQEFRSLQLEIRAEDDNTKHYLEARIFEATRLRRYVNEDEGLQETIVYTIIERCQGMYVQSQTMLRGALLGESQVSTRPASYRLASQKV